MGVTRRKGYRRNDGTEVRATSARSTGGAGGVGAALSWTKTHLGTLVRRSTMRDQVAAVTAMESRYDSGPDEE